MQYQIISPDQEAELDALLSDWRKSHLRATPAEVFAAEQRGRNALFCWCSRIPSRKAPVRWLKRRIALELSGRVHDYCLLTCVSNSADLMSDYTAETLAQCEAKYIRYWAAIDELHDPIYVCGLRLNAAETAAYNALMRFGYSLSDSSSIIDPGIRLAVSVVFALISLYKKGAKDESPDSK